MDCETLVKPAGFDSLFAKLRMVSGPRRHDYLGFCPAHNDRNNPSLCVTIRPGSPALLHCYAGCSSRLVIEAAGLTPQDLKGGVSVTGTPLHGELEQTYQYRDLGGDVLFLKRRYRTPEGGKFFSFGRMLSGVWHKGIEGVGTVPYNLHWIHRYQDHPVAIMEGEKDCDNMAACQLGYIPTTAHSGANSWLLEYGQYFTGRDCVVIPDNDSQGQTYAQKVIGSLITYGVRSVALVDMSGHPRGWDVTDVLTNDGKSALLDLFRRAPVYGIQGVWSP